MAASTTNYQPSHANAEAEANADAKDQGEKLEVPMKEKNEETQENHQEKTLQENHQEKTPQENLDKVKLKRNGYETWKQKYLQEQLLRVRTNEKKNKETDKGKRYIHINNDMDCADCWRASSSVYEELNPQSILSLLDDNEEIKEFFLKEISNLRVTMPESIPDSIPDFIPATEDDPISNLPEANLESAIPDPISENEQIVDEPMEYLRNYIINQIQTKTVALTHLRELPQNAVSREIAYRWSNYKMKQLICDKLRSIKKFIEVKDWENAWTFAFDLVEKPSIESVQNHRVYSVYADLLSDEPDEIYAKLLKESFGVLDEKRMIDLIAKVEAVVMNDLRNTTKKGKKKVTKVKDSSFSYEITVMLKALAHENVLAAMMDRICMQDLAPISFGKVTVLSDSAIDEWSMLHTYQYLQGLSNSRKHLKQVEKFTEWFRSFNHHGSS